MADNKLAPKRSNKLYYDDTGASDLDLAVQKQFGLQPGLDRANLIPYKDPRQGWVAPEWLYQAAKALAAPSVAYQGGNISPEETANVAMTIGGGGLATGAAAPAPANSLGMFIGRRAAQWNPKMMAVAEDLERKGVSPEEIWKQTGTWRAPDGQWRQEISDLPMKINEGNTVLGETVYHPELLRAYPNIRDVYIKDINEPNVGFSGKYQPERNRILLNTSEDKRKSTSAHEIQHYIQEQEGFSPGGTPISIEETNIHASDKLRSLENEYGDLRRTLPREERPKLSVGLTLPESDIFDWYDSIDKIKNPELKKKITNILNNIEKERSLLWKGKQGDVMQQKQKENYYNLMGEAEARATQNRLNLTDAQRRALFPAYSYDRPINTLIDLRKK